MEILMKTNVRTLNQPKYGQSSDLFLNRIPYLVYEGAHNVARKQVARQRFQAALFQKTVLLYETSIKKIIDDLSHCARRGTSENFGCKRLTRVPTL